METVHTTVNLLQLELFVGNGYVSIIGGFHFIVTGVNINEYSSSSVYLYWTIWFRFRMSPQVAEVTAKKIQNIKLIKSKFGSQNWSKIYYFDTIDFKTSKIEALLLHL